MVFDTLIRGASIIDGTGSPAFSADVGISGERICAVGDLSGAEAAEVIDGAGLTLTPGFIDAHTHSDAFILLEPFAPSKLMQGVTTEICGQCGGSAAPRLNGAALPSDWEAQTYPPRPGTPHTPGPNWTTVADYRECLAAVRPAVNIVLFAGHNTIRKGVMGNAPRAAEADEVKAMCRVLEQALDEGAWGMTTGLVYHPGVHAREEEVLALAQVSARHGGLYATHMRSESDRLLEAIEEVLALVRETGIRVQISHLKTSGRRNWEKIEPALARLNAARAEGLHLHSDRYPYTASGTDLDIILPDWAAAGGSPAILSRLNSPDERRRIIHELNASEKDPEAIMIGGTWSPETHRYSGKTLGWVMEETGADFGTAVADILTADGSRTGAFFFGMSDANLRRIYRENWIMPGSDASIRAPWGPLGRDYPHPRAYGTHPAFYRMLTGELGFSPEETIRRMTALPAEAFGISGRGVIKEGYAADLVLLDLDTYTARATYDEPHVFSSGVCDVFVNGSRVLKEGAFNRSALRKGRFLERAT